jgi:hypothetical protein
MAPRCSKHWVRRSLVAAAFLSRSAVATYSSSRSRQAACTRRRAAAALASAASMSLTRASNRCRRASVSGSECMTEKKRRRPQGGATARVWVAATLRGYGQRWGDSLGCWWQWPCRGRRPEFGWQQP